MSSPGHIHIREELSHPCQRIRRKVVWDVLTPAGGLGAGDSGFSGSPICPGYCDLHPFPCQHPPSRDARMAKILEGHDEGNFSLKYLSPQQTLKILVNLVRSPKDAVLHLFPGMGGEGRS